MYYIMVYEGALFVPHSGDFAFISCQQNVLLNCVWC